MMDTWELLRHVDHTLLAPAATWEEIRQVCDDGIKYNVASVCIPPSFVKRAKDYAEDRVKICTVVGFPNGYSSTQVKAFEIRDAVLCGADELDMVINIGELKAKNYKYVGWEIKLLADLCHGAGRILKVIVETCLLTQEEKIQMCQLVTEAGADFIKTSTGFSTGGATRADVLLFKSHVGKEVKIKAAGGIRSMWDAEEFIRLGCERLGTSSVVKMVKEAEKIGRLR